MSYLFFKNNDYGRQVDILEKQRQKIFFVHTAHTFVNKKPRENTLFHTSEVIKCSKCQQKFHCIFCFYLIV